MNSSVVRETLHHWPYSFPGALCRMLRRGRQGLLRFRCNICGRVAWAPKERLTRESITCGCGSSVRLRSLVHVLSLELFGRSLPIKDFPFSPEISGLDMSGAIAYGKRLASRLGYTNTFLHKEPRLDITEPGPEWLGRSDFVISSDVFEHVARPVSRAFQNSFRLLRPGGVIILTVPYARDGETIEHFPSLHDYRLVEQDECRMLINTTVDGQQEVFHDLVFHGGEGETLEMRVFSQTGVVEELARAGFVEIRIHDDPFPEFGIIWQHDWSLPISARRTGS